MQEEKKRTLTLDFQAFGKRLLEVPEPTEEQINRARQNYELLAALSGNTGPAITAEYLMALPEEIFREARDVVTGEATDAASQVIAGSIDDEQWRQIRSGFEDLAGVVDPTIGPQFI